MMSEATISGHLTQLQEMFPNFSGVVIEAVYKQCGRNLQVATDKLLQASERQNAPPQESKADLIAALNAAGIPHPPDHLCSGEDQKLAAMLQVYFTRLQAEEDAAAFSSIDPDTCLFFCSEGTMPPMGVARPPAETPEPHLVGHNHSGGASGHMPVWDGYSGAVQQVSNTREGQGVIPAAIPTDSSTSGTEMPSMNHLKES